MTRKPNIFICYSHKDVSFLEELKVHLKPIAEEQDFFYWCDTNIRAGDEWKAEIFAAIESCKCAILFVSPYFFASDFIQKEEFPRLLTKQKSGNFLLLMLYVSVSKNRFEKSPLVEYQMVNSFERPLDGIPINERHPYYDQLVSVIEDSLPSILEELYENDSEPVIQEPTQSIGSSFKLTATATVIRGNPDNIDADDLLQAMRKFDSNHRENKKDWEMNKIPRFAIGTQKKTYTVGENSDLYPLRAIYNFCLHQNLTTNQIRISFGKNSKVNCTFTLYEKKENTWLPIT